MTCGIYQIRNKKNNKVYVGQSTNIEKRFISHKSDYKTRKETKNPYLERAFSKYGLDGFILETIIICEKDFLNYYEIEIIRIKKSNNRKFGYNMTSGGNNPPSWAGKNHSEETKQKISKSNIGKIGSWTGRKHTEEQKEKIRIAITGHTLSLESRKKISDKNKGRPSKMKGVPLSEEAKEKISKANRGRVQPQEERDKRANTMRGLFVNVKKRNSSSKFLGVCFHKQSGKWQATAYVSSDGKRKKIHIGLFLTEIEAAIAYNEKTIEIYGDEAVLNIIPEENA